MTNQLTFEDKKLETYKKDNQVYLSASDINKALGFKQDNAVINLYHRHKKEFETGMSEIIKLRGSKNNIKIRVFNRRGAYLLGMVAKSARAAKFREWVLDVLENEIMVNQKKEQMTLPLIHVDGKQILNEDLRMQTALKLAELAVEILKFNKTA